VAATNRIVFQCLLAADSVTLRSNHLPNYLSLQQDIIAAAKATKLRLVRHQCHVAQRVNSAATACMPRLALEKLAFAFPKYRKKVQTTATEITAASNVNHRLGWPSQ
jgi:hypothetical protein